MKKLITLSCLTLFIALAFQNCRKTKNEDPCKDQVSFKTDFAMYIRDKYSKAKNGDTLIEIKDGDTCLADYIKFVAKDNIPYANIYDSVRWVIGNTQNTSVQKEFQLLFALVEYNIPISLTGYKKKRDNLNCFPNVPAVQTLTKTISV
ncbi:MAG: hypothetical protein LH478_04600, partial [Chitinophagaceae bacterium]|nr:hypothetical protein [Chitinophagaceae bacterium]